MTSLAEFIEEFRDALTRTAVRSYPPVYDAAARQTSGFDLRLLLRRPLGAQADAVRAAALSLQRHPATNVVGEMGSGKSYIALAAAFLAGCRRVLVVCPPHLVKKWQREVQQTVPGARVAIVRTIRDLERTRSLGGRFQVIICSREQAKLGYRWVPATVPRLARDDTGSMSRDEQGEPVRLLCCPDCFTPVRDQEGIPLEQVDLETKKRRCAACSSPLWQADRSGPRRIPLADYLRRRMPRFVDLLIADEVQEYKARGSAQGLAIGALAQTCAKTLTLTGTIFGGYSSTLFFLLWRFSPALRTEFGYHDEPRWISRYGIIERITKKDPDAYSQDGRHSKRRSYLTRTVEKPGISPAALFHLMPNTLFLRLADVARNLPSYTERVVLYPLDAGPDPDAPSQASCYRRLAQELRQAVIASLQQGSKRLLASYLQALLSYPDACVHGETVLDPASGSVIAHAPALPEERLYPKEQALVELVRRERARGRRVLAYITHTESRDISPRLQQVLEREGFQVAVLKAGTVAADRREEWVAARVREGADVLVCHPRLVQTGLDLTDWPSIIWYETEYSVYVMRQASRRSWRIGQHQPVEVTFLTYEGTLQAEALALVAAKARASLMIEGELPEEGLAALEGDSGDVYLALARRLVDPTGGQDRQPQSLEALFADARQNEEVAEELLIDGDWDDAAESARELMAAPEHPAPFEMAPLAELPLFAAQETTSASVGAPSTGKVLTFEELAQLVRPRKGRRKAIPEGQLALFGL